MSVVYVGLFTYLSMHLNVFLLVLLITETNEKWLSVMHVSFHIYRHT
jgi:hypothetical protein